MRTIDIHAHVTPNCVIAASRSGRDLHGIDPRRFGSGITHALSPDEHIASMDTLSIDLQVVSPQGQLYCYDQDPSATALLHRQCNNEVRAMVDAFPSRLAGLAILPMQDVDLAVAELDRATDQLGLRGAMIGDHVNGTNYDDPRFRPLWAAAESSGALLFIHQAPPTLVAERAPRHHLSNAIGNLVERTITFASLVLGGVLDEFPGLNICLAHGGGYVCFGVGRMDWAWQWREHARGSIEPPSAYVSKFFYDCITHNEAALRFLIDSAGADRVLFGSDFPGYAAGKAGRGYQPAEWLAGLASITPEEKELIMHGNLERLLGL